MRAAALALAIGATVWGCATDDVVVATLPGHESPLSDAPCSTNADCAPTEFCAHAGCDDARGGCQVRPLFCDPMAVPSCGCDGVTYWSDCLREQYGVSASRMGSCVTGAAACVEPSGADCPVVGASCAKLIQPGPSCDASIAGTCWVLPAECPDFGPHDRWVSCIDGSSCDETCGAIRSGLPHQRDITHSCAAQR